MIAIPVAALAFLRPAALALGRRLLRAFFPAATRGTEGAALVTRGESTFAVYLELERGRRFASGYGPDVPSALEALAAKLRAGDGGVPG